jgi:transcriptional regulator with XRE-family HTH domain
VTDDEDRLNWGPERDPNYEFDVEDVGRSVVEMIDIYARARNTSRQAIAQRSNLTPSAISKWAREATADSRSEVPDLRSLAKLAPTLEMTLGELLVRAGVVQPLFGSDMMKPGAPRTWVSIRRAIRFDPQLTDRGRKMLMDVFAKPGVVKGSH